MRVLLNASGAEWEGGCSVLESAEWLTAVVDSMVDFDVGSRVEVSRWKSLRHRRRIGLSID